jgi:hypothetical protein
MIRTEDELTEVMTRPRRQLIEFMPTLKSPLVILGAGGKMGPTLAILARRAADAAHCPLDIVAVSRFSDVKVRRQLESHDIQTLSADLMVRPAFDSLPNTDNLLYLVGLKFGTTADPARTWAINTVVPMHTAERYPHARIAVLSTGNVYPLVPVATGGSKETDPLTPFDEYANACVARERLFEYFSSIQETPITLLRLSFALDLRYGVLVDIASKVLNEEPVDVSMSRVNCIWQGDANEMIIRSLALAGVPANPINLVGSAHLSIREIALRFGDLMGKKVSFTGIESETAFLSNNQKLRDSLGEPPTPIDRIIEWTASWIMSGGRLLNRPTHFEVRDGRY